MVIDYREAERAIAAQKVLAQVGIFAVYIPDKVVMVSDNPEMTRWLVQRVEVPPSAAVRATALLKDHDLWEEPLFVEWD